MVYLHTFSYIFLRTKKLNNNEWHGTVKPGKLGDIAPSILHAMGLTIPKEMTGDILINP